MSSRKSSSKKKASKGSSKKKSSFSKTLQDTIAAAKANVRKTSTRKRSLREEDEEDITAPKHRAKPTEKEMETIRMTMGHMTMAQLRDPTGPFGRMPKSIMSTTTGRRVPKTTLRKLDLMIAYWQYGGKPSQHVEKKLKHWRPPRKISKEERYQEKLEAQRAADHRSSEMKASHHATKKKASFRKQSTITTKKRPPLVIDEDDELYEQLMRLRLTRGKRSHKTQPTTAHRESDYEQIAEQEEENEGEGDEGEEEDEISEEDADGLFNEETYYNEN